MEGDFFMVDANMYLNGTSNAHQRQLEFGDELNLNMEGAFGGDDTSPSSPEESESSNPPSPLSPPTQEEDSMEQPPVPDDMAPDMIQSQIFTSMIPALGSGHNLLIECPPGLDRKSSVTKAILNYWQWRNRGMELHYKLNISREESVTPRKIYIATRNYNETEQFLAEVKDNLRFTQLLWNLKISVLAQRENMCINEDVIGENPNEVGRRQGFEVDHGCRKLISRFDPTNRNLPSTSKRGRQEESPMCEYYHTYVQNPEVAVPFVLPMPIEAAFNQGHEVHDIEDFKNSCVQSTRCPYYDSRRLAQDADLIICSVDILLSPWLRDEYDIDFKSDIVLIDDGFDLENLCRKEATISMTMGELNSASEILTALMEDYQFREPDNIGLVELVNFLPKFVRWARNNQDNDRPDREAILEFITPFFRQPMNVSAIGRELREYAQNFAGTLSPADAAIVEMLRKFVITFDLFLANPDSFTVKFTTRDNSLQSNRSHLVFQIICADPSLILRPIADRASSLIVAASCIAPYTPFDTEYGVIFNEKIKIHPEQHSLLSDRLYVTYTNKGEDGTALVLNFDSRDEPLVKKSLGMSLIRISNAIPRGKLALFHSEEYLRKVLKYWRNTPLNESGITIMDALEAVCPVFIEVEMTKAYSSVEAGMKKFGKIACTDKGALLLALHRGNLYKNWDLNYGTVLGVIHVSIPYGPWYTNDGIFAKRKYLERKVAEVNCVENKDWYHKAAFRTLNQSYSCCIKNKQDRGIVIVLDSRMHGERHEFEDNIPLWVRHPTEPVYHTSFDALINSARRKLRRWEIIDEV